MTGYDFKFGVPTIKQDLTGQQILFEYDEKGRLIKVKSPYDPDYTMLFEYNLQANSRSYTYNSHYDAANGGDPIINFNIVNGFGKTVQVKKEIIKYEGGQYLNGMQISGLETKDIHGRIIKAYQPIFELGISSSLIQIHPQIIALRVCLMRQIAHLHKKMVQGPLVL